MITEETKPATDTALPTEDAAPQKPGYTAPEGERENRGHVRLHKIFLKDLSYESPNAPMIFSKSLEPKYQVNLDTQYENAGGGDYVVDLMVTVSVTAGDMAVFVIEVKMMGLFSVVGFSGDALDRLLNSDCAGMIYPYAREIISDMSTRGGFFPMVLHPVNFDTLYQQKRQQQPPQAPQPQVPQPQERP